MPVTAADIPQFVSLADRLRTETYGCKVWDKQGTDVIFARELVGMNFRTALELVLAHACDPTAKTPAAITRPFRPEPVVTKLPLAPKKDQECPKHPGWYADHCGACHTERLHAEPETGERTDAATALTTARAALRGDA